MMRLWSNPGEQGETPERIPVLAITTDESDKRSLAAFSARGQWDLAVTGACDAAVEMLGTGPARVIVCDRDLPGLDWRDAVASLSAARPDCPVILASPVNDRYLWEEVVSLGGYDVLAKPLREEQTVGFVNLAWSYSKDRMARSGG